MVKKTNLKRDIIISGVGGFILGIIAIILLFVISLNVLPDWLRKVIDFPLILIPASIAENYCESIGDHTFGCFGASTILFIIIYNVLLVIAIYLIYYYIKKWIESRKKKNKTITILTIILLIAILIFGIFTFFTTYFEGWIEPDVCEKDFLSDFNRAVREKNISFCNEFRSRNYNTELTRHSCYKKPPEEVSIEETDNLFTEEDCYHKFAEVTSSTKLCEKTYVDDCRTCLFFCFKDIKELPDNPEMCADLSNNFFKEECYDFVLSYHYEFEICDRVEDDFSEFCQEHINSNRQIPYYKNVYSKQQNKS